MDGKDVYLPPETAFPLSLTSDVSFFPYLYFDLACKQLCFPPKKGINGKN